MNDYENIHSRFKKQKEIYMNQDEAILSVDLISVNHSIIVHSMNPVTVSEQHNALLSFFNIYIYTHNFFFLLFISIDILVLKNRYQITLFVHKV